MLAQIVAIARAIVELPGLIRDLLSWFKKADDEKWFRKQAEIMQTDLPQAKTKEEFQDVAKKIQDQLQGL